MRRRAGRNSHGSNEPRFRRGLRALLTLLLVAGGLSGQQAAVVDSGLAPQRGAVVDAGTIRLHLLGREIGRESFTLRRVDEGWVLSDQFAYVDRGGEVALDSTLELADDLTPQRLRAEGRSYRFLRVDVDIEIRTGPRRDAAEAVAGDVAETVAATVANTTLATVRNLDTTDSIELSGPFFTVQGYAPLAARALLIGYWERHGRPQELLTVPGTPTSSVFIEERGRDDVTIGDTRVTLRRYSVRGVAWGREVVWLDQRGGLAAIFTRANILPFDGVRDDLVGARAELEALAVEEYMNDLARLSARAEPLASGAFALVGARLIDGTERAPIEDSVIVVRDGRIVAVGPRASTPIPDDVEVIEVAGKSIVPGLWDMHAHAAQIEWAPAYLAAGVTTARDMGGVFAFLTAFRDTIASGRGIGPHLLLAGLVDGDVDNAFGAVTAATPQEGRAVVERYHDAGFQQMKLYSNLQPEVVSAIAERAHQLGMTVTGHIPRALSLQEALAAGMDQIAHSPVRGDPGSPQMKQRIEALQRYGAAVDPTQSWGELLGRSQQTPIADFQPGILQAPWPIAAAYNSVRNEATPEAVAARRRRSLAGVRALHAAGVPVLAGTDYGVPAHSLHRELELYVMAGLTPLQAIRSATAVPAAVMGLADEVGTIEPGKRADLLVLDADPLADISAIRSGRWVIANGVMYACDPLWQLAGFRPRR